MSRYEDIDGVDAPFERAIRNAMKEDAKARIERGPSFTVVMSHGIDWSGPASSAEEAVKRARLIP